MDTGDPGGKGQTGADVVWSKYSCGLSVIEFQEAAEALASLYIPRYFTDPILGRWKQDHVALALVISLRVEMIHVIFWFLRIRFSVTRYSMRRRSS